MTTTKVWKPSRRELIASAAPLLLGGAALPRPLAAARPASPSAGNGRLRIFVLGDWGRDGAHHQRQVAALMDHHARLGGCDMVVTTGDNFYEVGVASVHDHQWRTSWEDVYAPALRARPWFPIAGNHDWGGSIFAQLDRSGRGDGWHMPWMWYDVPGARFGRPDVHLFLIDTTVWKGREKGGQQWCGQALRAADRERQKRWLADALRASCAPTKIVFGHHPVYATAPDGGRTALKSLDALLTEAKVSAYVCGHRHCLFHIRSDALDYVCSGGGSEERPRDARGRFEAECGIAAAGEPCPNPRLERFIGKAGFAMLEVGAEAMALRFVDRDGIVSPPATIPSRGNHGLGCTGSMPDVMRDRATAKGTSYFPCAALS